MDLPWWAQLLVSIAGSASTWVVGVRTTQKKHARRLAEAKSEITAAKTELTAANSKVEAAHKAIAGLQERMDALVGLVTQTANKQAAISAAIEAARIPQRLDGIEERQVEHAERVSTIEGQLRVRGNHHR